MKRYVLYAGVNGAGKSTMYHANMDSYSMARINTDEILKSFNGDWRDMNDVLRAGKIAVTKLHQYLDSGISFNQETTLCGRAVLNSIEKAHKLGYYIILYYVGIDDVNLAKKRVLNRVSLGGHGIDENLIEKRYTESLNNLRKILSVCDEILVFDNTDYFKFIASFKSGKLNKITEPVPKWFNDFQK